LRLTVRWRAGQAVAQRVYKDQKKPGRIYQLSGNKWQQIHARTGKPGREEDGIIFFFVEISKSLVSYFALINRATIFQCEISDESILEMSDGGIPGLRVTDSRKTGSQDGCERRKTKVMISEYSQHTFHFFFYRFTKL
jgi:hypothetical protein